MRRFDSPSWLFIGRVAGKAALLFILLNAIFAALNPMETLGQLSLYNWLLPGRARLPYGEQIEQSYNLSLNNVPAMFASHAISQPKAADEFRVIILGDSGIWGWFLENEDTLAGQLNAANLMTHDAKRMTFYNLGYPIMSLTKDLLILDEAMGYEDVAMGYEPDLIIWPVTLESFPRDKQLVSPIVQHNGERIRLLRLRSAQALISQFTLNLSPTAEQFIEPTWWDRTIIGQRRNLADLLRLQTTGFAWAATGIDQTIPADIPLRQTDLDADTSWQGFTESVPFTKDDLAFDVLAAGMARAGDVPVLLINEPMFISDGANSDLRYNSFYPIWAYDLYREMLGETAVTHHWPYLDLWNSIPPTEFTDTPVHLTPAGTKLLTEMVANEILETDD